MQTIMPFLDHESFFVSFLFETAFQIKMCLIESPETVSTKSETMLKQNTTKTYRSIILLTHSTLTTKKEKRDLHLDIKENPPIFSVL